MKELLFMTLALGWLALPVLPALRELKKPRDNKSLAVHQGNAADAQEPLHEGRQLLKQGESLEAVLSKAGLLRLEGSAQGACASQGALEALVAKAKVVELQEGTLHVTSALSKLTALHAPRIVVAPSVATEALLSATQVIALEAESEVRTAQAPQVHAGALMTEPRALNAENTLPKGCVEAGTWHELQGWWHGAGDVRVPAGVRVEGDIIAAGSVVVEQAAIVVGSIKAGQAIRLAHGVEIRGNCVGQDVELAKNALVQGSVIADETAVLREGAQVGTNSHTASVVAKDLVLYEKSLVCGGIQAHRAARVVAA